ncbi:MAG TPA: DMT family transporter [Stellaceae bacterium]|nr:DMT family transporter [Stellaceae bacterium]
MTAPPLSENRRAARLRALYPYLLLAGSQLCWAGNWVVGRAVRAEIPPLALAFWRWTIAALVLAPFALPRLRNEGATLRRSWVVLVLIGVSGAGFFQAMIYIGLRYTEALNSTMMYSASPLFIMLIAALMGVERVSARQIAGMAVSFCGILVILNRGDFSHLRAFHFNPGDLLILLAMPAWGFYCVLLSRRPRELDGVAVLFLISTIGALALAPFYAIESAFVPAPPLDGATLATLLYVGLVASVAAYILWNRGLALVGPNRAGFTNHLLPAFTVVLAVGLLGETLRPFHIVGIATILAGVWLATSARARA